MTDATESMHAVLPLRVGTSVVAVPIPHVSEIMRALPVQPLAGAPRFVAGLAIIRGRPTPVIDLRALLTDTAATPTPEDGRFVALRAGGRSVALSVDAVLPLRTLDHAQLDALPPLWQGEQPPAAAALGALDRDLLIVLEATRLLPSDWLSPGEKGGTA